MDRLVAIHLEHFQMGVPTQMEAAWLHHRFTQIHPFQDGNGRVARALASLIFIRQGWFPLVVHRDLFDEYIDALEQADADDLSALISLFSNVQKKAFTGALSLSDNLLLESDALQQVLESAGDRLKERKIKATTQARAQAVRLSELLEDISYSRFRVIAHDISSQLKPVDSSYIATAQRNDGENDYWFKGQIDQIATELGYYADTRSYRTWVRLRIREERQTEIIVSFHALGFRFLGLMAATAFLEHRDRDEDGEIAIDGPYRLLKDVFQYSYKESEDSVVKRFEGWLENVLLMGLEQWRRQL
jgi:hypothetical protein